MKRPQPSGCEIWRNESEIMHDSLMTLGQELDNHQVAIENFERIPDLLKLIIKSGTHEVCESARPHPDGLKALFSSDSLSMTRSGLVEPLFPPLRSHHFCFKERKQYGLSTDYLVHDFEAMCRQLKPHSKRVFIDLGASLSFHDRNNPIFDLWDTYEKFGFIFDHIYGFEANFTDPQTVYKELLPEKYFKSYHWINVGVEHEVTSKLNPLESILKEFDEDDFIAIKLDIDHHEIEYPLAQQLLEDKDGIYHKLVDQFYFEHHVYLADLKLAWKGTQHGTVKESLDLFRGMREKGIASHSWI